MTGELFRGPYGDSQAISTDIVRYCEAVDAVATGSQFIQYVAERSVRSVFARRRLNQWVSAESWPSSEQVDHDLRRLESQQASAVLTAIDSPFDGELEQVVAAELQRSGYLGNLAQAPAAHFANTISEVRAAIVAVSPLLGASAELSHDVVFVTADCDLESVYLTGLPRAIGVSQKLLAERNRPLLGELIVHESCHQKFNDVLLLRGMLPSNYSRRTGALLEIPWNPLPSGPRKMDWVRVASTLHVYIHLATYYAEGAPKFAAEGALGRATLIPDRIQYLQAAIQDTAVKSSSNGAWREFLDWLHEESGRPLQELRSLLPPSPPSVWEAKFVNA